ncbi:DUF6268 family outer membrane beta-barrel protein [Flavobacterium sp. 83]|uniref:DUF6268 family outer membrane beta-barrel protein n=1 Tax=Flavobacterium sp. 83 TaxID=1131812 RepID=UPI0005563F7B|nr:DUF6268 family outer membrane beta-barrel protein [Flavobacterium sp. 83]
MRIKTLANLLFMISILNASAQSGYSLELNLKTQPTEKITVNETGIGLRFFDNIDSNNKITNTLKFKNIGLDYSLENYDLQNSLNQFTSIENDFEFSHQLTGNTKLNLEINPTVNFERNLGISDVSILGGLEVNHSLNSTNTISIGVKRMTLFGKPEILPTFSFYHQINQNAFVTIGFPNSTISYSNNIRNTFSITNSFNGNLYNLDGPRVVDNLNTATKVSFSQMTSTLQYERNLDSNWFVNLKGGYEINKNYNLTNNNRDSKFDFKSTNGYIFNIGIKYKH